MKVVTIDLTLNLLPLVVLTHMTTRKFQIHGLFYYEFVAHKLSSL